MSERNQIQHQATSSSLGALGLHAPTNWYMKTQQFVAQEHGNGVKSVLDATSTVTSEECAKHSSTMGSNKDACVAAKCEWRDGSFSGGYCIVPGSHFVEEYRSKQTPTWTQGSCQQLLCSQTPPITDNG